MQLRPDGARAQHVRRRVPSRRGDRAILVLNALLGLGTVLAPVFVAIFVGIGFWRGMPVMSAALFVLLLVSVRLPLQVGRLRRSGRVGHRRRILGLRWLRPPLRDLRDPERQLGPARHDERVGASVTAASLTLTAFWAMVTLGRVTLRSDSGARCRRDVTYHVLPFLLAGAFVLIALLPDDEPVTAHPRVRSCRPGVLGPLAADDQLRPEGAGPRSRPRSPAV